MADVLAMLAGGGDDLYTEIIKENLERRVLIFNDDVNDSVIENYILYILKWNREDKDLPVEKRTPITIYINSYGGDVNSGFNMIDIIMSSKTPVRGVCMGMVGSMAYYILLSCHERIAFHDSVLLQHDGFIGVANSSGKARQMMEFFNNREERIKQFVLSRTNMTSEFYDDHYEQEYYMHANEEGKELGCVHKIIGEDIDLDEIL